jgi:hypothetical protein
MRRAQGGGVRPETSSSADQIAIRRARAPPSPLLPASALAAGSARPALPSWPRGPVSPTGHRRNPQARACAFVARCGQRQAASHAQATPQANAHRARNHPGVGAKIHPTDRGPPEPRRRPTLPAELASSDGERKLKSCGRKPSRRTFEVRAFTPMALKVQANPEVADELGVKRVDLGRAGDYLGDVPALARFAAPYYAD